VTAVPAPALFTAKIRRRFGNAEVVYVIYLRPCKVAETNRAG
jgi:hypothetical protein